MPASYDSIASDDLIIEGARTHNLKNISVKIPRGSFTVITGPSGSGKSSLAFDTIYAEGQRRYVESLSAYARQFLEQVEKPDVDNIQGLSPTISIDQGTTSFNVRSTVGTVTEILDYLRLLFARIGKPFCYRCGKPIESQSQNQILESILSLPDETKISLLAPIIRGRKGEYARELIQLRQQGFVRARIDGEIRDLAEDVVLEKNKKHDIDVYVDRLVLRGDRSISHARISESVELALRMGAGYMIVGIEEKGPSSAREQLYSEKFACTHCNISYPEPEPRSFSFNSPAGACPGCDGLGVLLPISEDAELEVEESEDRVPCLTCKGARLRVESLYYKIGEKNIFEITELPIFDLERFFKSLSLSDRDARLSDRILREISERARFLEQVGVGYLSLSRPALTLSGGESQRIRLATQIGSPLIDVIYVLDEPSIGLHPRDTDRLLSLLTDLKNLGNTVIVVEHDQETIERSDWIVDIGPGAGLRGGEIVAQGTLSTIKKNNVGVTGKYLSGKYSIPVPEKKRLPRPDHYFTLTGVTTNNLKNVDFKLPLGLFVTITGVSGSGKSSLILDTLFPLISKSLLREKPKSLSVHSHQGLEHIDKIIDIDQAPIGRTPRSNPATYTGLFSLIRELFATLPESQIRGFKPGMFSFNVKGGRCEKCEGDGVTRIEMHFMPDVYVNCDQCLGSRYQREILEIRYKGKNISEVLNLSVEEALAFFDPVPLLKRKLKVLNDVGLGYIKLGQSAPTLSGGESQRMKLSRELSRVSTGKTIYILDEPSTGLHFDDIKKLISILQSLVDQGNTVVVIEHNLDIIKVSDYVFDLGPEGGSAGGYILAQGPPEVIARDAKSVTGKYLKPFLKL